ncbi:MAG TPA: MMPL family transporter, partial [Acidimicrobiales bacterium]|nr:MMPL family transporter [Acidimicrobiales bacterium]
MSSTTSATSATSLPGTRRRPAPAGETGSLGSLAGWCYDHRRRVLALWILGIIAVTAISQIVGTRYQDNFSSGNSDSQQVQNILASQFPSTAGTTADVVIHTRAAVTAPDAVSSTARMVARLRTLPNVSGVTSPFAAGAVHQISADGHIAFAVVQLDRDEPDISNSAVKRLISTAQSFAHPGYDVELGGQVIGKVVTAQPGPSEGIGIVAAMIIMLIAFGSLVAMGLPIMAALFGIAVGFALEDLLSHILNVPVFAPEMLAMIGLGVGIDYALFIVTRFRDGLDKGREPRVAMMEALATSGRAVLFAGCTVIISLLGLFIVNLPFMQGLAVGAIAAVLLVMAAALTLLPAMLGFAGRAVDRLRVPG